jgi:hypothetical protein
MLPLAPLTKYRVVLTSGEVIDFPTMDLANLFFEKSDKATAVVKVYFEEDEPEETSEQED